MQSFRPALLCVVVWAMASRGALAEPAPVVSVLPEAGLRHALAAQAAEILRLEAEVARLRAALAGPVPAANAVVALGEGAAPFGHAREYTPTSSLTRENALQIGRLFTLLRPGTSYATVLPTGSMKPFFDEKAILLTENAPFSDLKVGDIVTYRHPSLGRPVVHRLVIREGDRFWAKGDANGRMDTVYVTKDNYLRRVYGMVYGRE
jgi:signal peptidase